VITRISTNGLRESESRNSFVKKGTVGPLPFFGTVPRIASSLYRSKIRERACGKAWGRNALREANVPEKTAGAGRAECRGTIAAGK
jgi:hypothetical protein